LKIAVSGKGGVGKTSVSAALTRLFARNGYKVIAVDADPDASLGISLGISDEELAKIVPLSEMEDVIKKKSAGGGAYYALNPQVDDVLEEYSFNLGNIKFLRMGAIKPGGSACYCKENTFLYAVIDALILDQDDVVILDMGAGIEHLTRGTSKGMDLMIIVTEPSKTSVQTAGVVKKLSQDLGIESIKFIANKVRSPKEAEFIKQQFAADELLGVIEFDNEFLDAALGEAGQDIITSTFETNVEKIYSSIVSLKTTKV